MVVALTLLAGCESGSGSPSPTPTPPGSSSASPSSSPAAEAEAAVRAYYAEINRAASTGQVTELERRIKPECSCARLVRYIEQKWAAGSLRGAVFTVQKAEARTATDSSAQVIISYSVTRYQVLDRAGKVTETVAAVPSTSAEVRLAREETRWVVTEVLGLGGK